MTDKNLEIFDFFHAFVPVLSAGFQRRFETQRGSWGTKKKILLITIKIFCSDKLQF